MTDYSPRRVVIQDRDGAFVAYVEIMPINPPADVLLVGLGAYQLQPKVTDDIVYREASVQRASQAEPV